MRVTRRVPVDTRVPRFSGFREWGVKSGKITISHVPDVENPADFLTKWVKKDKLRQSIDYFTNAHARRDRPP